MDFYHSALFHMKTRVFLKYFLRRCRSQIEIELCIIKECSNFVRRYNNRDYLKAEILAQDFVNIGKCPAKN